MQGPLPANPHAEGRLLVWVSCKRLSICRMLRVSMFDLNAMFLGCAAYLKENPQEIWRVARDAANFKFGLPIVALRWLSNHIDSKNGPKDIELDAVPPGIRVTATVEEMGTWLRGSAVLTVLSVDIAPNQLRVVVRLSEVTLKVLGESPTPLAALVRSGALDLTKVANLVAHMPKRPAVLVDSVEDRLVLDFMRWPHLAQQPLARQLVSTIARLLKVEGVETDNTHLSLALSPFPNGLRSLFR